MPPNPIEPNTPEAIFKTIGTEPLGRGTFGETWLAEVIRPDKVDFFGKKVVLKIPHSTSPEHILQKELAVNSALLNQLVAPNVIRYIGVEVFRGRIVMVMEFANGGSLRDRLRLAPGNRLPIDECVELTKGILEGLKVIHRAKVFHRDLKPENILLSDGVPKIADFGLSRVIREDENEVSAEAGTRVYQAPEIWLGNKGTFSCDIWALGVTLYEMVCGCRPFQDRKSIKNLMDKIERAEFTPVCDLRPDIPPYVNEIVIRALQKAPKDRFQSADEMLDALTSHSKFGGFKPPSNSADDPVGIELVRIRDGFGHDYDVSIVESLEELLNKHPHDPRILHCLGEYYTRVERLTDSLESYKRSVACDESYALSYYHLGLAYQRAKQTEAAITALERADVLGLDGQLGKKAKIFLRALDNNR